MKGDGAHFSLPRGGDGSNLLKKTVGQTQISKRKHIQKTGRARGVRLSLCHSRKPHRRRRGLYLLGASPGVHDSSRLIHLCQDPRGRMPIQSGLSHAPVETQVRCSWRSAKYISSAIVVYCACPAVRGIPRTPEPPGSGVTLEAYKPCHMTRAKFCPHITKSQVLPSSSSSSSPSPELSPGPQAERPSYLPK